MLLVRAEITSASKIPVLEMYLAENVAHLHCKFARIMLSRKLRPVVRIL